MILAACRLLKLKWTIVKRHLLALFNWSSPPNAGRAPPFEPLTGRRCVVARIWPAVKSDSNSRGGNNPDNPVVRLSRRMSSLVTDPT